MSAHLMNVYNRAPLKFARGEGSWLFTEEGDAYLDCVGGIATVALGHSHPKLVTALKAQADKLWHVSNAFEVPGQAALAARLTGASFADTVFFCNSGTEAVECALKTARRYHVANGQPERIAIIGFNGAFHGRSYAAINAAGNSVYLDGFGPRLPGYVQHCPAEGEAVAAALASPATAAVIIEPVQGEGGARAISAEFLQMLRRKCSEHGVLLIHDEVQSGMGRTGRLFAHQWFDDVAPDIMTIAKGLGGGFPVGACLATSEAAKGMTAGAHGSTFGGNPLAMAVASAVFDEIAREETLAHARAIADYFRRRLQAVRRVFPEVITEVRGLGLLIGLKLKPNNREFVAAAREHRLLVAGCGDNCIRLLPPLNLSLSEAATVIQRLCETCETMRSRNTRAA